MPNTVELANRILEVSKQSWLDHTASGAEISEMEFISLEFIAAQGCPTVGEIRKHIGVLAAQMSRVVRSLEDSKYIVCSINHQDKRKIDVRITDTGRKVLDKFLQIKLKGTIECLEKLTPEEQCQFITLIDKMVAP